MGQPEADGGNQHAVRASRERARQRQGSDAQRERRQRDVQTKLAHVTALASLPRLDTAGLSAELRARLTDWRGLLNAEPIKARQIVRKLVPERITFTPNPA